MGIMNLENMDSFLTHDPGTREEKEQCSLEDGQNRNACPSFAQNPNPQWRSTAHRIGKQEEQGHLRVAKAYPGKE